MILKFSESTLQLDKERLKCKQPLTILHNLLMTNFLNGVNLFYSV